MLNHLARTHQMACTAGLCSKAFANASANAAIAVAFDCPVVAAFALAFDSSAFALAFDSSAFALAFDSNAFD